MSGIELVFYASVTDKRPRAGYMEAETKKHRNKPGWDYQLFHFLCPLKDQLAGTDKGGVFLGGVARRSLLKMTLKIHWVWGYH